MSTGVYQGDELTKIVIVWLSFSLYLPSVHSQASSKPTAIPSACKIRILVVSTMVDMLSSPEMFKARSKQEFSARIEHSKCYKLPKKTFTKTEQISRPSSSLGMLRSLFVFLFGALEPPLHDQCLHSSECAKTVNCQTWDILEHLSSSSPDLSPLLPWPIVGPCQPEKEATLIKPHCSSDLRLLSQRLCPFWELSRWTCQVCGMRTCHTYTVWLDSYCRCCWPSHTDKSSNKSGAPKFGLFQRQSFLCLWVESRVFDLGVHEDPKVVSHVVPLALPRHWLTFEFESVQWDSTNEYSSSDFQNQRPSRARLDFLEAKVNSEWMQRCLPLHSSFSETKAMPPLFCLFTLRVIAWFETCQMQEKGIVETRLEICQRIGEVQT